MKEREKERIKKERKREKGVPREKILALSMTVAKIDVWEPR